MGRGGRLTLRLTVGVALEGGAMVGDTARDVEAGNRLGLTTVRLGPSAPGDPPPSHEAPDLLSAAGWLRARASH